MISNNLKHDSPDYRNVRIFVKDEYKSKFDSLQFKLEDFECSNILDFDYRIYTSRILEIKNRKIIDYEFDGKILPNDIRFFIVYLKQAGEVFAKEAVDKIAKQDFVKTVGIYRYGLNPGIALKKANVEVEFYESDTIYGGYDYHSVRIFINDDYIDKFDSFQFKPEDFENDNILNFEYRIYTDRKMFENDYKNKRQIKLEFDGKVLPEDIRFFVVYLKKTGEIYAKEAVSYFTKLSFIKKATFNGLINPGITLK